MFRSTLLCGLAALLLCILPARTAQATPASTLAPVTLTLSLPDIFGIDLGDIIKAGGVIVVVNQYGEEINNFINKALDNEDASVGAATKVVVIVSPAGKYLGAAQVTGPRKAVEKVKAVAQIEKKFRAGIRVKAMIPIETESYSNFKRVQGVAVSAVIDIKI